jgi:hypothetical protein
MVLPRSLAVNFRKSLVSLNFPHSHSLPWVPASQVSLPSKGEKLSVHMMEAHPLEQVDVIREFASNNFLVASARTAPPEQEQARRRANMMMLGIRLLPTLPRSLNIPKKTLF